MAQDSDSTVQDSKSIMFIFPPWVGHLSPSLPMARRLVGLGHDVYYVCHENVQAKIEATGAKFYSAASCQPELYHFRGLDCLSMFGALRAEFGLLDVGFCQAMWQLRNVMIELQLPGLLRLLRVLKPDAVVFCPLSSPEAAAAAAALGIPHVALNTFAGPGGVEPALCATFDCENMTLEKIDKIRQDWSPNVEAVNRMREKFGITLPVGMPRSLGFLDTMASADLSISTSTAELEHPMTPEMKEDYEKAGASFVSVGPLLDDAGGWRSLDTVSGTADAAGELVAQAEAAAAAGRPVVLVSMGTVVTGDMPLVGWRGRAIDSEDRPRGLSGKELCQAAWAGAFDAFGAEAASEGALILVATGSQSDALEGLEIPANAVCVPFLPQVDILRAGVHIFLTHGGQNSFTESLANGTPVLVCPGFADQIANSCKAVALGVGLKVDRPDPELSDVAAAAAQYRADVKSAMLNLDSSSAFRDAAGQVAKRIQTAGGVELAVGLVLEVASKKAAEAEEVEEETAPQAKAGSDVELAKGSAPLAEDKLQEHARPLQNERRRVAVTGGC